MIPVSEQHQHEMGHINRSRALTHLKRALEAGCQFCFLPLLNRNPASAWEHPQSVSSPFLGGTRLRARAYLLDSTMRRKSCPGGAGCTPSTAQSARAPCPLPCVEDAALCVRRCLAASLLETLPSATEGLLCPHPSEGCHIPITPLSCCWQQFSPNERL